MLLTHCTCTALAVLTRLYLRAAHRFLLAWDKAMMSLDEKHGFLASPHQWVTHMDDAQQVGRGT